MINHAFLIRLFNRNKKTARSNIIQFGPIRSGSILVYNILRETCNEKNITKVHQLSSEMIKNNLIVVTYRNPMDCLSSSFLRYGLLPTQANIENQIEELMRNGLVDLYRNFEDKRLVKLKYESFYNNFEYILDIICASFKIIIPYSQREELKDKYTIENVTNIANKYDRFGQYDETTKFHGKHISKYKGQPNSYKQFFNEQQVTLFKTI